MIVKNYSEYDFLKRIEALKKKDMRILNAGSAGVRYGENCVNIDIQNKKNVDVVCDIHSIPESIGKFDVIICNAALQYCHSPHLVAKQFFNLLNSDGYLFVDAPFVQGYCPDMPDLFRFTEDGLKAIFSDFEIVDIGASIRPGSAFAYLGVQIAEDLTDNKYVNFILSKAAYALLYPFRRIRTNREEKTAGAFYMICKKKR